MEKIKVLVIDDSFTMRLLISDILNADPSINVAAAVRSGEEAINILPILKPDCIILDLVMPGMGGFATLKAIMSKYPTPIIILSAYSKTDADIAFKCLAIGAMNFIPKPSGEISYDIDKVKKQLIEEIKAASCIKLTHLGPLLIKKLKFDHWTLNAKQKIVVIGASTGGPKTLEVFLSAFPADFPAPIILAQHMPQNYFLDSFVERLEQNCWLQVKLAKEGDPIRAGTVYCLPSGFKATIDASTIEKSFHFIPEGNSNGYSPCIDDVMTTISQTYDEKTIGIILTGMGSDGVEGMRQIKNKGGTTIVQDEQAILFGMPKAVIDHGLADHILSLETMPETLARLI